MIMIHVDIKSSSGQLLSIFKTLLFPNMRHSASLYALNQFDSSEQTPEGDMSPTHHLSRGGGVIRSTGTCGGSRHRIVTITSPDRLSQKNQQEHQIKNLDVASSMCSSVHNKCLNESLSVIGREPLQWNTHHYADKT